MVKGIGQLQTERILVLGMLRKWVNFSLVAPYSPPKKYYNAINRLAVESRNVLDYCEGKEMTDVGVKG